MGIPDMDLTCSAVMGRFKHSTTYNFRILPDPVEICLTPSNFIDPIGHLHESPPSPGSIPGSSSSHPLGNLPWCQRQWLRRLDQPNGSWLQASPPLRPPYPMCVRVREQLQLRGCNPGCPWLFALPENLFSCPRPYPAHILPNLDQLLPGPILT